MNKKTKNVCPECSNKKQIKHPYIDNLDIPCFLCNDSIEKLNKEKEVTTDLFEPKKEKFLDLASVIRSKCNKENLEVTKDKIVYEEENKIFQLEFNLVTGKYDFFYQHPNDQDSLCDCEDNETAISVFSQFLKNKVLLLADENLLRK